MAYYSDRKLGDRRFPGPDATNEAPEATPQNPGQFFPASDDSKSSSTQDRNQGIQDPDHLIGNPYLMHTALNKLDHSLSEVIEIMENEGYKSPLESNGDGERIPKPKEGTDLLRKFQAWRGELVGIREGHKGFEAQQSLGVGVEESARRPSSSGRLVSQEGPMFTD